MRTFRRRIVGVFASSWLLTACGDEPVVAAPPLSDSNTAMINGVRWDANPTSTVIANATAGDFVFYVPAHSGNGFSMQFALMGIKGVGTYALGTEASVGGGIVTVGRMNTVQTWQTRRTGSAGTILITEISKVRMRGSFSFIANPYVGGASGNLTVTDGVFDVAMPGATEPVVLAQNRAHVVTATIGGVTLTPATISLSLGNRLSVQNDKYELQLMMGDVTAPGTYVLASGHRGLPSMSVSRFEPPAIDPIEAWNTFRPDGSGSFTISSITPQRMAGSFTALVPRVVIGSPVSVSGTFDLARPPIPTIP